jgi:hypothetical protein
VVRVEVAHAVDDAGVVLLGGGGDFLRLLRRDLFSLFRRDLRLAVRLEQIAHAARQRSQHGRADIGQQLVQHAGTLRRVAAAEQLADQLRERRRLVGAQGFRDALREGGAGRLLRHIAEVLFGTVRIGRAGVAQVLL